MIKRDFQFENVVLFCPTRPPQRIFQFVNSLVNRLGKNLLLENHLLIRDSYGGFRK
jgi:hypothetical protein